MEEEKEEGRKKEVYVELGVMVVAMESNAQTAMGWAEGRAQRWNSV